MFMYYIDEVGVTVNSSFFISKIFVKNIFMYIEIISFQWSVIFLMCALFAKQ